jgi:uncharacterized membrane protein YhaH (DUF805 family)
MIHGYLSALKKYATLQGRSSRAEYWSFAAMQLVVPAACVVLHVVGNRFAATWTPFLLLAGLHSLITIVPGFAVTIRRLHDVGKSGAAVFWSLLPGVGGLIVLSFLIRSGEPTPNRYGEPVRA